ncbi:AI-2E family transporter [Calidifontibacter sp. DB0510]|uniref:AI-2E family transporter n=1 Tax=Metallococcus carri TaxID=1656884 RepID=A0A967B1L7_9MICO|nr:AI-2E family transporter [Metallococcus carri]NHN55630.1 AI-2E family transporter [Metallococcus carri]NOP38186.1 AI-2E family transporter [Calidifontibacter sp. DB2511S]
MRTKAWDRLKHLRHRSDSPQPPGPDDPQVEADPSADTRPKAKGPTSTVGSGVARARTENRGLDRAQIISHGLRWTSTWSLRFIFVAVATWLLLKVLAEIWPALLPIFLALVISTVLWPPARWLRNKGVPPTLAAVLAMLLAFVVIGGIVAAMAPTVGNQWPELTQKSVDGVQKIQEWLEGPPFHVRPDQIDHAVSSITAKLQASGNRIAEGVFSGVTIAGRVLLNTVIALILTFLFIKDGPRFLPWLRIVTGRGTGAHFTEALSRVWLTLSGFIRTQAIVSAVDSFMIGLGLVILRVPLAAPLAVLTFFGGFIPIVGAFVAGTLAVLVALVTKGVTTALIVLIIIVFVQQVEGHVLQPLLQSRSMSLHPALVLLSIALGGDLFGIVGAFFAVPVTATVAVVFRYLGEQIDLRTGDVKAADLEQLTPEGKYAAEQGEKHGRELSQRAEDKDLADADGQGIAEENLI